VAKARKIPGLSEHDPYALAAARIVGVRTREVIEHSADVLDISDIERVHDMRVATRRLRAALEVFAPCFPKKRFRATLREVNALADALGERRDRDVTIAALSDVAAAMGAAERTGIESLVSELRGEQASANDELVPFVAEERLAALVDRLEELVGEAVRRAGIDEEPPSADELLAGATTNGAGAGR
jgi:CHAD domain-containing protein